MPGLLRGDLSLASDEVQLLVLGAVGISAALVGVFLVLRGLSMLANSLSHTILLGIVAAFFWGSQTMGELNLPLLLLAAIITGLLTAFLTQSLHDVIHLQEDAANGLVFTTLFALGIVWITVAYRNTHIGIEVVTGNADALDVRDLKLVGTVLLGNLLLLILFFRGYYLTMFDRAIAKNLGFSVPFFTYLLMAQVSCTAVAGFRAVGVLLVLAMIVAPALAARRLTHSLIPLLLIAALIGVLGAILGVALARHLLSVYGIAISTGGIVVCSLGALFLFSLGIDSFRQRIYSLRHHGT
ncbi:MAG: metal ABC transporter permease [Verrucomicrobia bacterium]|nr:metal ABC transporter permease [Verrucomicrobiota bacterium]